MTTYAQTERAALADLLLQVGPDAPTLCEGWTTQDLAAHLVIRDRRPDAGPGIVLARFAPHTAKVQAKAKAGHSYEELVDLVRSGPPKLSPLRLRPLDEAVNTVEYYVHRQDVLRAVPSWTAEATDPDLEAALWRRLARMGKGFFRRAPTGVTLEWPNHDQVVAHAGDPMVTVAGEPGELVLFAFGRSGGAQVRFEGDSAAVTTLQGAKFGL